MIRRSFVLSAAFGLAFLVTAMGPVRAQETPDGVAYVVTYLEVAPTAITAVADLLRAEREASRSEPDVLRYQVLQRAARRNQFVILEEYRNAAAQQAHAQNPRVQRFRDALSPSLISPYDERPHSALAVQASPVVDTGTFVVTHVDIIPTQKDVGVALVSDVVAQSRSHEGNVRIDALTQNSRPNHMTIVEAWRTERAQQQHAATPQLKEFRTALLPLSGSLYDERLYRSLP
jgi:quinol monooxygenase YgiN